MEQWNDDQPIYRQLHDRMVGLILDGTIAEGESIPSVRTVAAEYQINHLTVSKAYQGMVDEGLIEKKRGLGMFVVEGARENILQAAKQHFLTVELPKLVERIRQLGISSSELQQFLHELQKDD